MIANIKLTKFISDQSQLPDALRTAWPVSILAQGTNMDDAIFVYQVGRTDDPIPGDKFQCVASVNQMYELPKNHGVSVTLESGIPFYRSNILQFVCRSATEAERIWNEVIKEVQLLVANVDSVLSLQATQLAQIDSSQIAVTVANMITPPVQIQISSHPAGTVANVGGQQSIVTPDSNLQGWLPASAFGPSTVKPAGAAFFYNLSLDTALGKVWPPLVPYEGNQLHRNGIAMPYGIVWSLTADTVWWLSFNPTLIPGYQRTSPGSNDGSAPWPTDYVDAGNPGAVQNILTLTLFK